MIIVCTVTQTWSIYCYWLMSVILLEFYRLSLHLSLICLFSCASIIMKHIPSYIRLLLLLSRFSCVRLCVTPWTAAYQASPSMGFSRQEHWSGLPFPSPMHESGKWKWSPSACLTLSDPMDCSLPGSSIHGIFRATVLEWGAIAFSTYVWVAILKNMVKDIGEIHFDNFNFTQYIYNISYEHHCKIN